MGWKKTLNGRKLNLNIADDDCDYYNSDSIKAVNKIRCFIPKVGDRSKCPKIFFCSWSIFSGSKESFLDRFPPMVASHLTLHTYASHTRGWHSSVFGDLQRESLRLLLQRGGAPREQRISSAWRVGTCICRGVAGLSLAPVLWRIIITHHQSPWFNVRNECCCCEQPNSKQ